MELVTELLKGFLLVHVATELIHIPQLDVGLVFAVEHIGHMTSFLQATQSPVPWQGQWKDED
jgi:hypothetical protein